MRANTMMMEVLDIDPRMNETFEPSLPYAKTKICFFETGRRKVNIETA